MTREAALAAAAGYLTSGRFEADLARRVAIPTESQADPAGPDMRRYLNAGVIPDFHAMGFATEIFETEHGAPVLLASRDEGADLTVLGYGHGDVVRGQTERWTCGAGPWTMARVGDRLYGRGTADNKGQHTINMGALAAVLAVRGRLGFNARFLVEMGEETGSPGLGAVIAANRGAFAADVMIASDGPRVAPGLPTVSLGARGSVNFDLVCRLRDGAHHSGNWGGALADPGILLAHAMASLTGPRGEILVPGWEAPEPSPAVRAALAELTLDGGAGGPRADTWWGAPGTTPAGRVYGGNAFAVLALSAGQPDAPVNAIPPEARAHCQLRFVAGTDSGGILPALRAHLDAQGFDRIAIVPARGTGGFDASRTEPDHPWAARVIGSLARTTGRAPAVIPQMGGSICNALFTDLLGLPAIWIPHSYSGCCQHAPDEHLLLPVAEEALRLMAGLYWDIGDSGASIGL